MSLFGVMFLAWAAWHDVATIGMKHEPVFWPYALIALSFYVGLDVMLGAIAEAWEDFRKAKIEALLARNNG